ncbi:response regulator [Reichenbachiella versicolor]|uniref:response regulator n=1 Tax=Reichenbachiella versicolor TaxID=1821036 RepID=UPI000D6E8371|nr:response regulator [Reichenbachiella versicolor]
MSRKIAVIDDDEVFQLIIRKQLEMKGLECDILKFYNGQEAIDFFNNESDVKNMPDLVLLDVNMPVKDGWGFLEEFKELPDDMKEGINLYMVTSSVIQSDIDRATQHGDVKEFVSKPITNDKLEEIFLAAATS